MKIFMAILALTGFAFANDTKTFGDSFDAGNPKTLTEVLSKAGTYETQDVVVTAEVQQVCQKKGCWFEINADGKETTKVVFKDYSFFVPADIAGKTVVMNGRLKNKKMSVKEQRHYLKDAGASKEEIKAIKEPKQVYQFVASGVKI